MTQDRRCFVYRRVDGLYDWHRVATSNGMIVSNSAGQGFTERNDAVEAARREHPDDEIIIDGTEP